MSYDFSNFKTELVSVKEWLSKEFSSIRTGQATPAIFDTVSIDSYGTKSPIAHVAGITSEGPRSLRISPWNKDQIKVIEKAITVANLGVSVSVDDTGLRVSFPELTTERREMLKKLTGEKLEHAKVSMRKEREKVWNDIQDKCKDGEISEDEKFRLKDELQKMVDETTKEFEAMGERKEKEIME
jgi:ribosome recycling factor